MFSCSSIKKESDNPNSYNNFIYRLKSILKVPLQAHIKDFLILFGPVRRIYKTAPSDEVKSDTGSVSVEAALVLPLFIFALLSLFSLGESIRVRGIIYEGFHETAEYMAESSYLYEGAAGAGKEEKASDMLSQGISLAAANHKLNDYIDDREAVCKYVNGGMSGIYVTQAELGDDDYVYMKLYYSIEVDVPMLGKMDIPCREKIRQRAYLGYTKENDEDSEGTYIYMAENGRVYHSSRKCYHIKLAIKQVDEETLRSSYSRLTPCRLCARYKKGGAIYVTEDGDRYHYSLGCSGLKRTIYRVKKDECGVCRPCSACGK